MDTTESRSCIVLLSGGLDSATVLAHALSKGYTPVALSFSYGQKHTAELAAAAGLVALYDIEQHFTVNLDPRPLQSSALTGAGELPLDRSNDEMQAGIAPTYVPARNILFLSYALAFGEELDIRDIFLGVNSVDYSGYPDCRHAFIRSFEAMANQGTSAADSGRNFRIHAPLQTLHKHEIIRMGHELGVDYSRTVSCYAADQEGRACGHCDACQLRAAGFREARLPDPTRYRGSAHP